MTSAILSSSVEELEEAFRQDRWDAVIGMQGHFFLERSIITDLRIRETPEDFRVIEVLRDGSIAGIKPGVNPFTKGDKYALYVATKRNMETWELIRDFALSLRVKVWDVQHLGLKDKRAITSQFLCVKLREGTKPPEKVGGGGWQAELYGTSDIPLEPEDLAGNSFEIVLKVSDRIDPDRVNSFFKRFVNWSTVNGIPDFYGYQRFGSSKPINHIVGYLILRRDFSRACEVILGPSSTFESDELRSAREGYRKSHDVSNLLVRLPPSFRIERKICSNLSKEKTPQEAIMRLPAVELRFLLESLSSFIFNLTLSKFLQERKDLSALGFFVPLDDFGCPIDAVAKHAEETDDLLKADFQGHKAAPAIPMPGYLMREIIYDETRELMQALGIEHTAFLFKERPQASYPGGLRPALSWPKFYGVSQLKPCYWSLSFFLKKGSYATVLLRELSKPKNPCLVGF